MNVSCLRDMSRGVRVIHVSHASRAPRCSAAPIACCSLAYYDLGYFDVIHAGACWHAGGAGPSWAGDPDVVYAVDTDFQSVFGYST